MWAPMHRRPTFVYKAGNRRTRKSNFDTPKLENINKINIQYDSMEVGHCGIQGLRPTMEDDYVIDQFSNSNDLLVAIMDGQSSWLNLSRFSTSNLLNKVMVELIHPVMFQKI